MTTIEQLNQQFVQDDTERLRIALNAAQMGMWDWNLVTGEINWSSEHEQLFGLPSGSFDGSYETFDACLHPDDRDGLRVVVAHSLRARVPYQHEFRVIWADGSIHWIEGRGQAFYDELGEAVRMLGTVMAIDDRKRLEGALKQSEQQFRAIFEAEPECVKVVTADGMLQNMNPAGLAMIEADSLEAVLGQCVCPLVSPAYQQAFLNFTQQVAQGKSAILEFEMIGLKGTQRWLESHAVPLIVSDQAEALVLAVTRDITERKQAEIELVRAKLELEQRVAERTAELTTVNDHLQVALIEQQQAKQEIEDIYNNSPCGYHSLDADGKFVRINNTELQWLGYTRAEILHQKFADFLTPESKQVFYENFPNFKQQGCINNLEFQMVAKDGSTRWFNLNATAIQDDKGNFIMSHSNLFDIDERKRLQEKLTNREAWLNTFFTHSPIGMAILDNQMRVVQINASAATFNNLAIEEHIGNSMLDLFPDWASTLEPIYQQVLETGQPLINLEVSGNDPRKKGALRHFLVSYQPILTPKGQVNGFGYVAIDVSDRKRTEAALSHSEEKFRQLAENIQDVFWIADIANQQVLYVSPAYETLWGRSRESLYQNFGEWLNAIHPEDRPRVEQTLRSKAPQGCYDHEYRVIHADGSIRWIRDRAFPIKNEAGEIIRTAGIAEDITERQRVEEIKNEFISIVSHELRTPLMAIQMSLGLLKTGIYANKPDKAQRMIEIASIDTNRLVNLVNDILDLERLESGRTVLEKTVCQAYELMQQAVDGVQALASGQNITLVIAPSHASVWAAGDTIVQTLTNLLSNAIKFSPPYSVIHLGAEQQIDHVLFQVSDTGRGIPADKLETIFGRFQQVDASDARSKGGTGLGLPICRSIVEKQGGKIWAESTLGTGSKFFFTLPVPL
ncbi:two-component hybrid sensor and regulator [Calothrix sp. NIES-4071]|nr:two-component hybrid sensor and regulator [Calothrix sp. NIES-4071]BAZ56172.1 two-component hybrid sensor and regulator [Calothrix sp. NIES-4105]